MLSAFPATAVYVAKSVCIHLCRTAFMSLDQSAALLMCAV
jgi:hypothetical protein